MPQDAPPSVTATHSDLQPAARAWFEELRDRICHEFESIEDEAGGEAPAGRFRRTAWDRPTEDGAPGGGGVMSVMHGGCSRRWRQRLDRLGRVQPGVPRPDPGRGRGSALLGQLASRSSPTGEPARAGGAFQQPACLSPPRAGSAAGAISRRCGWSHPSRWPNAGPVPRRLPGRVRPARSGLLPEVQGVVRPLLLLPHRGEPRGAGGIFFDHHRSGDLAADFAFVRDVGLAFSPHYYRDHPPPHASMRGRRPTASTS